MPPATAHGAGDGRRCGVPRVRARRGRLPPVIRWAALVVLAAAIFAVGVAVGQALHDNPRPGGTQRIVRTLKPLPLAPAAKETVTITSQNP